MARLTPEQWQEIRQRWQSDEREGYEWLATEFSLDRSNLRKKAVKEGWCKNTPEIPREVPQLPLKNSPYRRWKPW